MNPLGETSRKWKYMYVLVHFYEEDKYSVLPLKETTPQGIDFPESYNFEEWDTNRVVNAIWGNEGAYPAYFLKFSENKNELEKEGVEFAKSLAQTLKANIVGPHKNSNSKRLKTSMALKKKNDTMLLDSIKERLTSKTHDDKSLEKDIVELKKKNENLSKLCKEKDEQIAKIRNKMEKYKAKYKKGKKDNSTSFSEKPETPVFVNIGPNVSVPINKHILCRTANFSKYTADLMEVVFGTDVLSTHLLKGIKGSIKTRVLDAVMVSEIQSHVALKFGVTSPQVRYAMRLKLNYAHKLAKRESASSQILC